MRSLSIEESKSGFEKVHSINVSKIWETQVGETSKKASSIEEIDYQELDSFQNEENSTVDDKQAVNDNQDSSSLETSTHNAEYEEV